MRLLVTMFLLLLSITSSDAYDALCKPATPSEIQLESARSQVFFNTTFVDNALFAEWQDNKARVLWIPYNNGGFQSNDRPLELKRGESRLLKIWGANEGRKKNQPENPGRIDYEIFEKVNGKKIVHVQMRCDIGDNAGTQDQIMFEHAITIKRPR